MLLRFEHWNRRVRNIPPRACVVGLSGWISSSAPPSSDQEADAGVEGQSQRQTPHSLASHIHSALLTPCCASTQGFPHHEILQQNLSLKAFWKTDFHLCWGTLLLVCSPSAVSCLYMYSLVCLFLIKGIISGSSTSWFDYLCYLPECSNAALSPDQGNVRLPR